MTSPESLAADLIEADRTKTPIPPLREQLTGLDLDGAYRIQQLVQRSHEHGGAKVVGRKIGLTSFAMQQQLGVDSPDFGFVTDAMRFGDGASFSPDSFIAPKVEPELGFVLKADLNGPGVTFEQVAAAVATVHPALEIIDSRVADWNIKLVDTVADNASCGAIAVSSTVIDLPLGQLADLECRLLIDEIPVHTGTGADVMGHPLEPLVWLANVLGERGVPLRAGEVVLTGSFTAAVPVTSGSTATADFGSHGCVSIHFE